MGKIHKSYGPYEKLLKRPMDFILAVIATAILLPIFIILSITGAVAMKGNPFFLQERPGWNERIFKLIKFRTMDNRRDKNGKFLPDKIRLNSYGRFLRSTSLDELPELFNILKGDMSIVGPRPLLVQYLPRYSEEQHRRHEVRPGLTGYAQVNGRNTISWEERFQYDIEYVDHITFLGDMKIILRTVFAVLGRMGIHSETAETMEEFKSDKKNNI